MKNKALAIVLALCMVLAMLPMNVHAAQPMDSSVMVPNAVGTLEPAAIEPNARSYSVSLTGSSHGETELLVDSPAEKGSEVYFLANPDDGYLAEIHFSGLDAEDFVYIGMDIWGFIMPGNKVTLEVTYVKATGSNWDIAVRASEGGQFALERETAKRYESVLLLVLPNDGVSFDPETDVTADSGDLYYLMEDEDGIHYYELVMPGYDVNIEIRFGDYKVPRYVQLKSNSNTFGTVSVNKTVAYAGDELIVTAIPNIGYELFSITGAVDGNSDRVKFTSIGNNQYKAVMPDDDVDVSVTFVTVYHNAQVNVVGGVGGTAKLDQGHPQVGSTVTVTCQPDDNYRVYSITGVDGLVDKGNNVYEFVMPDRDVVIDVTFKTIYNPVTLTVDTGIGGTASVDLTEAKLGDTVTVICAPEEGYRVAQITGVRELTDNGDNTYSFVMPDAPVELHVLFLRQNNPFLDVNETHFFYDPVLWAVEEGITSGMTPETFGPFSICNRAQVVTFLWRAAGSPEPTTTENPFTDVPADSFYYKPVLWAVENGITNGVSSTEFGPGLACNRAQVVTFLHRSKGTPEPEITENPFEDVKEGDFFHKAVLWALENGVTTGADATHFNPNGQCQRAQVVTFLYRAKDIPMTYAVDAQFDPEMGTVTLSHTEAQPGEIITATVIPAEGYVLDWAKCEFGTPVTQVSDTEFTFVMPEHAEVFHVNFSEAPVEPDPTDPTEPSEPDPTEPTEPTDPTEPEPTDPTEPTDPSEPEPTDPTEPTQPVQTFELDLRDNGSGRVAYVDGKTTAAPGESIFFYALPNEGYYLDHVGVFNPDGAIDVSTIMIHEHGDGLYELIMIPHDLIMTCYFYPNP